MYQSKAGGMGWTRDRGAMPNAAVPLSEIIPSVYPLPLSASYPSVASATTFRHLVL